MLRPQDFRQLALALPEVVEQEHQNHPDFRVAGKVFATLGGGQEWGMVRLPTDQQAALVREYPDAFSPSPGAWGKQGCTKVILERAKLAVVQDALRSAWRARAPKRLHVLLDDGDPRAGAS